MKNICFLLPALISVEKERKEKDSVYKVLSIYAKYCLLINLTMFVVLIVMGRSNNALSKTDSIQFYTIYIIGSLILSYLIPLIIKVLKKNFSFKIKGTNNEKN